MPATSSASVAIWSGVARSAARPAAPTSRMRRASYISSRVNPWSAARKLSASVPSDGGPAGMKVPEPCRDCTTPIAASARRPARTVGRLTPICSREIALGRQAVARPQLAALDQGAHVRHHLLGAALAARAEPLPSSSRGTAVVMIGKANYRAARRSPGAVAPLRT